jgi:hypothetical protein
MSNSNEHVGFVAPDPADLNKLFPGYEIEGLIATGGMGAVYCAVQKSLDRTVALKILPHEFSNDAAFREGFEAEAKAMGRLNNPNLIGVYDFGEAGGMLYIIMEYVAGQSIYHSANGQAIDPMEVNRLVTGVCNGLAHAHENGIIHRDIKPSNILLDLSANPKIGDFGLARPVERKVQEGEEIFGTPHYTAPEVVNAPHSVDFRADIFSVGVLLHELLTGKLPATDPRPPSMISRCDSRYDAIVRRATHPAPAARYASAAEMAKDLAVIANSPATQPIGRAVRAPAGRGGQPGPRVAAPLRARKVVQVKKSSNYGSFIIFLIVVSMGLGAYSYYKKQQRPPQIASAPAPTPPAQSEVAVDRFEEPKNNSVTETVEEPESRPVISRAPLTPDPAETHDDSEPVISGVPKFDVPAFFLRARGIMKDRAKSYLLSRESALQGNLSEFGKELKRSARKADENKAALERRIETRLATWQEEGSRIPEELDDALSEIPDSDVTLTTYQDKEKAIEQTFLRSVSPLSATYIVGLEKQIERLKADNDPAAVELIFAEIRRTKDSSSYFPKLMLGINPETALISGESE